jgi:hypothetical protein
MTRKVGNTIFIEPQEDAICEFCGKLSELRPYGPKNENICFDCAMKDEKSAATKFAEFCDGPSEKGQPMKLGASVKAIPSPCTGCGKVLDMAACVDGDYSPEPGNITVCFTCGHLMAYNNNLKLRDLTDKEIIEVAGDRRIIAMQKARSTVMKKKAND